MKFKRYLKESSNDCKNYRTDTESCAKGCPKEGVISGNYCKFEDNQEECSCYKS